MNIAENNKNISLIVTAKNRVDHFIQVFPSLITQYGIDYELIIVDFASSDPLEKELFSEVNKRKIMFSLYLQKICYVKLMDDLKFNPRKAKNLGARYAHNPIFAFSDIDTFLGIDYLYCGSANIELHKSFFVTRQQDTMASLPCRLKKEINYGNIMVFGDDFYRVRGFDESVASYGGDDDDLCHRLKLKGLREINPLNFLDAKQYSILHDDELRTSLMEDSNRGNTEKKFEQIYRNKDYDRSVCEFLLEKSNVIVQDVYKRP